MSEVKIDPCELVKIIRGCPFPNATWLTKKKVEDAMDYIPKDGDVIIASYPKSGTNWLVYIIMQIVSKGDFFPNLNDTFTKIAPFIDMSGIATVEAIESKPRMYKHHFRYNMVQKNSKAKYIYIYRNPEDIVVSFFQFAKSIRPERYEVRNFDQFFDDFVAGDLAYGSHFEHVLSYYECRESEGLLMLSYEDLSVDRRKGILRIAQFLGDEYHQSLLENEDVMNKVIAHTSFDYMKKNLHLTHPFTKDNGTECETSVNFFRKGIVGDGKNSLTPQQRMRVKEAAKKVLTGTTILDEWFPR